MSDGAKIPVDLILVQKLVYDPSAYKIEQFLPENESLEYGACSFTLNNRFIKFRTAKITPTKAGQFVTLWKRNEAGITQPHDINDIFDLYIISVRKAHLFGQFVFTKSCLVRHGILSVPGKEGKRGFRVYPPWDTTENKQAQKTQQWQRDFFLEINDGSSLDVGCVRLLYSE